MRIFPPGFEPQGSHFLQATLLPLIHLGFFLYALRHRLDLPWAWYPVFLAGVAALASMAGGFLTRHRHPAWWRTWGTTVAVVALYAVNGLALTGTLALSARLLIGWGLSCFAMGLALWITRQLGGRSRLWAHLRPYQGEELRVRCRDYEEEANFTPANRAKLIGVLRVLTAAQVALAWGLWEPDSWLRIVFWLVLQVNLEALYRAYRAEMEWFSLGHRVRMEQVLARAGLVVTLSLGALVLATTVIPHLPRYHWEFRPDAPPPRQLVERAPQPRQNVYGVPTPPPTLPEWWVSLRGWLIPTVNAFLAFLAQWGVPILLLLALLLPAIHLARSVRWSRPRLGLALWRRWAELVRFFRGLSRMARRRPSPEPLVFYPTNREIWLQELRESRRRSRKRPSQALVRGFLLLLDAGEKLDVRYRRGMTTRAYLEALVAVLPSCRAELGELADLMDAGFFRAEPLNAEEERRWRQRLLFVLDAARKARHNQIHDHPAQDSR